MKSSTVFLLLVILWIDIPTIATADWPQFMRDAAHTGDAADEVVRLPLRLYLRVGLDDAILTTPAVIGSRAWVVDQMGTAYGIDVERGILLWKTSPEQGRAMGFNTCSPCVANGRVYYATTAGNFHILDAETGRLIKTVPLGAPVISSTTWANDSIYLQTVDAVVWCFDPEGNVRWTWNHYMRYREPPERTKAEANKRGHPGSYERPHYGGQEVCVAGRRVITSMGWDLLCLEDRKDDAEVVWCNRAPAGRDGMIPMSSSVSSGFVYTAGMGADGVLGLMRTSLETGETLGIISGGAFPWITPAVRGTMVIARGFDWLKDEILAVDFETKRERLWQDKESASPVICSHALTRNHVVVGLFTGELLVLDLIPQKNKEPFRFLTPSGKPIGSSPSVSGGKIYFGCDDGCLYVLGPANEIHQSRDDLRGAEALVGDKLPDPVVARRSSPISASRANYHWPSCLGNPANTCHVNDPDFKAPLRLRWVSRGYGHFKTPLVASEEGDLLSITLIHGIVTCQEQMTGRLRWRVRCPPTGWAWSNSSGLLVTGGRVYVPRPNDRKEGLFMCLNLQDGSTIWTQPIGGRGIWARSSPVLAGGKVAFAFATKAEPPPCLIRAWDVATGKPSWEVELNVSGNRAGALAGCTDGTVMYFTAGAEAWQWKQEGNKKRGEAVAIEAATGKVLWRSDEFFGSCCPVLAGDRLLLNDYAHALNCVNPKDGSLIWRTDRSSHTHFSVGADHIVSRGYGGWASKLRLEDGKPYPGVQRGEQLGGDAHACGPVVLTPNLSIAVTVAGLHLRDVQTGSLLWLSPGFAARACVNPSMALGRLFFPSATSGTIFCWESSR